MDGRLPRLLMAAPIAAVLAATLAASGGSPVGASVSDAPALRSISSRLDGAVTTLLIESSAPVAYLTSQPNPMTVFIDLRNVAAPEPNGLSIVPLAPVSAVAVENATAPDGAPVARVRVQLSRAARYKIRSERNVILLAVDRDGPAPRMAGGAPPAPPPSPAALVTPASPAPSPAVRATAAPARAPAAVADKAATELRSVKALARPDGLAVALSGNGRLIASTVEEARDLPPRLLLDFRGVAAGRVPAMTPVNQGGVERVRVGVNSVEPLITRVVIDLARKIPYTVEAVGDDLRVLFTRALDLTTAVVSPVPPPPPPPPAAASFAPLALAAQTTPPATPPPAPAIAVAALSPPQDAGPGPSRFTGHPITLDFQGADLRAVLRTFSEISGLNIVIDPTINGSVDVSLREVPWDQALDIILKANKLGYSVDGTIVRIAPLKVLTEESDERGRLAESEAKAKAAELPVLTRAVSYAKASDLVAILKSSALSKYGDVQIDPRTNTLIIRDLADRLTSVADLISTLDRPQPQVEIEARIVQTTRDFARALGVQWGFNGRVDPALGTSTGLAFPSSGSLSGRAGGTQGPNNAPTGVGLPAPGATSAVGLALGSINGALNLDVALTALESTGKGRLLSTPRVSTQNNVEAEITQGVQIPIQTVANNTVTVTFKDAALILKVTPQITASNTVIMKVSVENSAPDYSKAVNGIPPINSQKAVTTVLVNDGDTTVIGGIYVSSEQTVEGRTPFLHRLPLLGWLFRRDLANDESTELLIFITPRITK